MKRILIISLAFLMMVGVFSVKKIYADEVDDLIAALLDEDWNVRYEAAESLGKIGDLRAVEPLIVAFRSGDIREKAAEALVRIGKPAVEPLIKMLIEVLDKNQPDQISMITVRALGAIGDSRAVEPVIKALSAECNHVRHEAARVLGKIGDSRAVEPLINALSDNNAYVRHDAAISLGKIGDSRAVESLINALSDKVWWVQREATVALGKIGDSRAVEPLITAFLSYSYVIHQAIDALVKIGDSRAVEPLIAALSNEDENIREKAAEALGKIGDSQAVEPLIAALSDEDENIREKAAEALGKIGDLRAVKPLSSTALWDSDLWVRDEAEDALVKLGEIADARAVEPLLKLLGGIDKEVQNAAKGSLSEIQSNIEDETLSNIIDNVLILTDTTLDTQKRVNAALTLGKIGDLRAVDAMARMLADDDSDVVLADIKGLVEIGEPAIEALREYIDDIEIGSDIEYILSRIENDYTGYVGGNGTTSFIPSDPVGFGTVSVYSIF